MLVIDNVHKHYGPVRVLNGVTLQVFPGEILALVGPSGCGKTTLLRLIAGFERPGGGRILIEGAEVSSDSTMMPPHRRKLSMVFQDLALWPHMTVGEHLRFVVKKDGRSKQEVLEAMGLILRSVRVDHLCDRYPHQLSGGEKQRLAIARALASTPAYILMDEPFSHLDPPLKEDLQQLLLGLNREKKMGIVYVTHNMEEAHAVAGRIAFMDAGFLVRIDNREESVEKNVHGMRESV